MVRPTVKNSYNEPMQGQVENYFNLSGQSFLERWKVSLLLEI